MWGPMRQTRVLVADDNDGFGTLLSRFVAVHPDLRLVGRAHDGQEAISMTDSLAPDVVVMDLFMPRMDGFEATRLLASTHPEVSVVVLTAQLSADNERRSIEAGASAYVPKVDADTRLIGVIRALAPGGHAKGGDAAG